MKDAFITRRGGSGAGLNLKVVDGTTQPSGAENTIWVNTDIAINGYAFSATEPESPVEGMAWFATGTSATAPINIDKKNSVMIYPNSCYQYISGAWISKTAKTYLDGAWVDWFDGYYYKDGETYEYITGGYETTATDNGTTGTAKLTFNADNMVLSSANNAGGGNMAASVNLIDLTDVDTLIFDCKADVAGLCNVGVFNEKGKWSVFTAKADVANTDRKELSVDVSAVDSAYIFLKAWNNSQAGTGVLTIYRIYGQ